MFSPNTDISDFIAMEDPEAKLYLNLSNSWNIGISILYNACAS